MAQVYSIFPWKLLNACLTYKIPQLDRSIFNTYRNKIQYISRDGAYNL